MKLDPIYNLITSSHFPSISFGNLSKIKNFIKEYTFSSQYCFDLKNSGGIEYCDIYELIPSV